MHRVVHVAHRDKRIVKPPIISKKKKKTKIKFKTRYAHAMAYLVTVRSIP
jgi:hypothetical protein